MMQTHDPMVTVLGYYGAVAYDFFKALVAIALFGMVAIGFLFTRMTVIERIVSFAAALMLLGEFTYSDELGYVLAAAIFFWQWRKRPAAPLEVAPESTVP